MNPPFPEDGERGFFIHSERLLTEPLKGGAFKGHFISKDEPDQMLDEYYTERGWDVTTGAQTKDKLIELGLGYVVEELKLD